MGKQVTRMGGNGDLSAKLAMNLMIALTYEGFADGLTLAKKLRGWTPSCWCRSSSRPWCAPGVDYKAPFVLGARDFTPSFPLRLMQKDIKLMLEAAERGEE